MATNITLIPTNGTLDSSSPPQVDIFFAIFLPILCSITSIANFATIVAFFREPSLRERPSELLILSLACADFGTGFLALPLYAPAFILPDNWPLGEIGCRIQVVFFDLTVHASLLTLLSISVDRFLLVFLEYPKYLKVQTYRTIRVIITICWAIAVLTAILEMSMWNIAKTLDLTASQIDHSKHCLSPPRRMRAYSLPLFIVFYFIPISLMITLSVAFLYLLHRRLVKHKTTVVSSSQKKEDSGIKLQSTSSTPNQNQSNTTRSKCPTDRTKNQVRSRYTRPAITLFALLTGMAICMLPYCMYVMINDVVCQTCTYDVNVFVKLLLLQFCNAFLDPFLYALTQRKIRKYYKNCLVSAKSKLSLSPHMVKAASENTSNSFL